MGLWVRPENCISNSSCHQVYDAPFEFEAMTATTLPTLTRAVSITPLQLCQSPLLSIVNLYMPGRDKNSSFNSLHWINFCKRRRFLLASHFLIALRLVQSFYTYVTACMIIFDLYVPYGQSNDSVSVHFDPALVLNYATRGMPLVRNFILTYSVSSGEILTTDGALGNVTIDNPIQEVFVSY